MIRLFSSFNNAVLILLFFYVLLFRLALFQEGFDIPAHDPEEALEPFSALLFGLINAIPIKPAITHFILSTLVVYIQALILNNIFFKYNIFKEMSYLPSLVYVLLASLLPEMLVVTEAMMGSTFIILAVELLYSSFQDDKAYGKAFNIGLLAAIASLFYFPYIVFFVFALIAMLNIRPFIWREYVILFLGLFFAYYALFIVLFLFDKLPMFYNIFVEGRYLSFKFKLPLSWPEYTLLGVTTLTAIAGIIKLQQTILKRVIRIRIYLRTLLYMLIFCIISIPFARSVHVWHFFVLVIPLTAVITEFLKGLKRITIAEIIHVILFLLILFNQFKNLIIPT